MSYYRKMPVLDEKEQAEFDKYLKEQYLADIQLAQEIAKVTGRMYKFRAQTSVKDLKEAMQVVKNLDSIEDFEKPPRDLTYQVILDKLATPRIYLLQAWIHRKAQIEAGVIEAEKEQS